MYLQVTSYDKIGKMMMHAYDKSYLDDVMSNLGAMMDYGINGLGYSPEEFLGKFISSGIAGQIERGHPRYLAGLSGIELALMATGRELSKDYIVNRGPQYWAGWAMAYLQWETGLTFGQLMLNGMDIQTIIDMYHPYHEADVTKFVNDAKSIMSGSHSECSLKQYRKAAGLSQEELAAKSGITVRAIRSYEQNARILSKAGAGTVLNLAKALGCRAENLVFTDLCRKG